MEIDKLSTETFNQAVDLLIDLGLDTREEIENHLKQLDAHYIAQEAGKVVGVIGWYQDDVNYANEAMGDKFPGKEAYWVGFFGVEEKFQGKGIGTSLLNHLENEIGKLGIKELWVSSVPESKTYYESKGFKLITEGEISESHKFFLVKRIGK